VEVEGKAMDVLIAGSLLSLMICVGALAAEWRLLAPRARKAPSDSPEEI
jgi:hypothetical protein